MGQGMRPINDAAHIRPAKVKGNRCFQRRLEQRGYLEKRRAISNGVRGTPIANRQSVRSICALLLLLLAQPALAGGPAPKQGVSRRAFLKGAAALSLVALAPKFAFAGWVPVPTALNNARDHALERWSSSATLAEKRTALAKLVQQIRANRGYVSAEVMEQYRALSKLAFEQKHGRTRLECPISLPHYVHGYPRSVKVQDIHRLVQQMVTESYDIGFRKLGETVDFWHGHILFAPQRSRRLPPRRSERMVKREVEEDYPLEPKAVIYHTQEYAKSAVEHGDTENGYVNRLKRNWLQDFKTGKVYDAAEWVKPGETMNSHYTLFDHQLDVDRLGLATREVITRKGTVLWPADTFQFNFFRLDLSKRDPSRSDQIVVELPTGEEVLLGLGSNLTQNPPHPYN